MSEYEVGRKVNLEVDLVARYLERLLLGDKAADAYAEGGLNMQKLMEAGFVK
jgi:riboflavin synthase